MKKLLPVLMLSALLFVSCSKGGDTIGVVNTGDNTGAIPSTKNTMTVTINGTVKTFQAFGFKFDLIGGDTSILVAGASPSYEGVGFGTLLIHSTGKYNVGGMDSSGILKPIVTMNYQYIAPGNDSVTYATEAVIGTPPVGTLTITELTSTSLKAAFHATLKKKSGISGAATVDLTNGGVNVTLN